MWAVGKRIMPPKVKRTRELTIRVTDEELASIRLAAETSGLSMADLARRRLLEAGATVNESGITRRRAVAPKRRPLPVADPSLVREVARVGANLNQVAKWANTYKTAAEAVQITTALIAIREALDRCTSNS
jgi:hypothetical protein